MPIVKLASATGEVPVTLLPFASAVSPTLYKCKKIYTTSAEIGRELKLRHNRRCVALWVKMLPTDSPLPAPVMEKNTFKSIQNTFMNT